MAAIVASPSEEDINLFAAVSAECDFGSGSVGFSHNKVRWQCYLIRTGMMAMISTMFSRSQIYHLVQFF